jgi:GNAT superfamily N-acetyltransferase
VSFEAPAPLADRHVCERFACGVSMLDEWLKRRARANQASGASRTYVVCQGNEVLAYYALASGAVDHVSATGRVRRNMPDPVPVAVLARLAIASAHQRSGLGRVLVRDAALRVLQAAEIVGIRALLVHAVSLEAKAFYAAVGFEPSPWQPMVLMATLRDLSAALG